MESVEKRFWKKANLPSRAGTNECWIWQAAKAGNGYGYFWFENALQYAHRVSWQLCVGPIPEDVQVLHDCPDGDNPACVNPDHLWLGTIADNVADMVKKGRSAKGAAHWSHKHPEKTARGEKQGNSKLTSEKVKQIRLELSKNSKSQRELAKEFGVGQTAISNIFNEVTWKHS